MGRAETFSSLQSALFVVDGVGIVWEPYADLIGQCIKETAADGFVVFTPWYPGIEQARAHFRSEFQNVVSLGSSQCGFFREHERSVASILRLRQDLGGDRSGEWCVGSCFTDGSTVARTRRFHPFAGAASSIIVGQHEAIGCALALDEKQQSTFACRLTPATIPIIDRLSVSIVRGAMGRTE